MTSVARRLRPAAPVARGPVAGRGAGARRGRGRRRGMTLLEVLAALVLIGIVVPVAMRGVSVALAAASGARHTAEAAALADRQLNEVVALGPWNASGQQGTFEDFPDYRWRVETYPREYDTVEVAVEVTWTERATERSFVVSTLVFDSESAAANAASGSSGESSGTGGTGGTSGGAGGGAP